MGRIPRRTQRPAPSAINAAQARRKQLPEGAALDAELAKFDRVLRLRPGDFVARTLRALHLGLAHRWPEAQQDADKALAQCPHGHPAEIELLALRSMTRREMGQLKASLADLNRLMSLRRNPEYMAARGEVYRRIGDNDAAMADLDESIEARNTDPFAFISRGRVHLREGRIEEAIEDLDIAIELDPADISAVHHRARAHRARGDETAARADWETALQMARDQGTGAAKDLRALAWIAWISAEGLGERLEEALELMEKIRSRTGDFEERGDLMEILGRVHFRLEHLEEALRCQEKVVALCPDDIEVQARLEEVKLAYAG